VNWTVAFLGQFHVLSTSSTFAVGRIYGVDIRGNRSDVTCCERPALLRFQNNESRTLFLKPEAFFNLSSSNSSFLSTRLFVINNRERRGELRGEITPII
jgi:hypothetical protein